MDATQQIEQKTDPLGLQSKWNPSQLSFNRDTGLSLSNLQPYLDGRPKLEEMPVLIASSSSFALSVNVCPCLSHTLPSSYTRRERFATRGRVEGDRRAARGVLLARQAFAIYPMRGRHHSCLEDSDRGNEGL
jgi:hypothetical protein